ncbi:hypothetical protein EPYR_03760 [Erwinia pyrifoliae DSM 12163]|nr:hypothetical protein EPYR_03760 [Erwinia pyrifoliae DSM 12163]
MKQFFLLSMRGHYRFIFPLLDKQIFPVSAHNLISLAK